MASKTQIHATCVAIDGAGVVLRGPPGSGKSDLALRLIDRGARLVADDRTDLQREGNVLVARAPAATAGMIEVRGVGIVRDDAAESAAVALVVDMADGTDIERMPEPRTCDILGLEVPVIAVAPWEASADAKVRLAVRLLQGDISRVE
jgi:HPr kinase/phosphorylase